MRLRDALTRRSPADATWKPPAPPPPRRRPMSRRLARFVDGFAAELSAAAAGRARGRRR